MVKPRHKGFSASILPRWLGRLGSSSGGDAVPARQTSVTSQLSVTDKLQLSELQAELDSLKKAITVINQLSAELDIHAALDNVRDVALSVLACERVTNFLIFDGQKELRGKVSGDLVIRVKFGEGIAGTVAQTGQTMHIPDAYAHPLFSSTTDRDTGYHTRNILCCAISDMSGRNVAVLQALNKKGGKQFTMDDERNLQLFGTHLGNTLAKAKLHEAAKREKERVTLLYDCFKSLSAAGDLNQVLTLATDSLQDQILDAEVSCVFLVDAPRGELWLQFVEDEDEEPTSIRIRIGQGVIGQCALDCKPVCIPECQEDDDPSLQAIWPVLNDAKVRTLLVHPVVDPDSSKCIAVILAVNKKLHDNDNDLFHENVYSSADSDVLALFALEVADALHQRSLEVSLASALSVATHVGATHESGHQIDAKPRTARPSSVLAPTPHGPPTRGLSAMDEDVLRSQLMHLYFQSAGDMRRHSSMRDATAVPHHTASATSAHWGPSTPSIRRRSMVTGPSPAPSPAQRPMGHSWSFHRTSPNLRHVLSCPPVPNNSVTLPTLSISTPPCTSASSITQPHSQSSSPPYHSQHMPGSAAAAAAAGMISSAAASVCASPTASNLHFHSPAFLVDWNVDFTAFSIDQLVQLAYDIFVLSGAPQEFGIGAKTLHSFLTAVASQYREEVPYHNFCHVVHVLHSVFMLLHTTSLKSFLHSEDVLSLLVSAVCHDLDHDGHSNSYHVNRQTEWARIYNDMSVMENHHCALTFQILAKRECNLFEGLTTDVQRRLRKYIVASVLCTDMVNHFALTQEFSRHSVTYDPESDTDRLLLTKVILHASDIGNGVRPFHINHILSQRVHHEFESQAAEEVAMALPVTFSVDTSDVTMCARLEVNFLDYVVLPLWERLGEVLPQLEAPLAVLRHNRTIYHDMSERGKDAMPPSTSSLMLGERPSHNTYRPSLALTPLMEADANFELEEEPCVVLSPAPHSLKLRNGSLRSHSSIVLGSVSGSEGGSLSRLGSTDVAHAMREEQQLGQVAG